MTVLYWLARPILFLFDAETAHNITLRALNFWGRFLKRRVPKSRLQAEAPTNLAGVPVDSIVGLAPGFIKHPKFKWAATALGFGFAEIGTLTRLPQRGNPRPRIFRLKRDLALINRLGFNNPGFHTALKYLNPDFPMPLAINLGKNKYSPANQIDDELGQGIDLFTPIASWFVINLSSPNTPGLRALLEPDLLDPLLRNLNGRRQRAAKFWSCPKRPLLLKLHPDLDQDAWDRLIAWLPSADIDGIVATNTTLARKGLQESSAKLAQIGGGGLSGRPLSDKRNEMLVALRAALPAEKCIVAVGGIGDVGQATQCLDLGASALEIYTGLIYRGPKLVRDIAAIGVTKN